MDAMSIGDVFLVVMMVGLVVLYFEIAGEICEGEMF